VASSLAGLAGWGLAALALVVLPTLLGEASVYKLGLVLILFVGAIGLHLLVNWAGELSLAHAAMVGLPAFVVAKVSADHHVSPVVLLPLGLAVGLLVGAVVGLPAIRARGLQVALVTLAAGVAIDRFFFTKEWIVGGQGGAQVAVARLGPLTFATARSLYPLLAVVMMLAVFAAGVLYRSKVGRGFLWVKANPEAAAAFGVPVALYRTAAYALAGGFAGLSGGLTAMWVGRLTPQAFPLSKSFTYLIVVALAGRGFVGGVAAAATFIEGGRLFLPNADAVLTYGAPVGLILTLTQHRAGLNGFGRQIAGRVRSVLPTRERTTMMSEEQTGFAVRPLLLAGAVVLALGFAAIALAWYHAGNTSQVWVQNQELISGGVGGLALVVVGVGLLVSDRMAVARAADAERWERLIDALGNGTEASPPAPRRSRRSAA
jgi:branched-chain amino acid transport system permease protein